MVMVMVLGLRIVDVAESFVVQIAGVGASDSSYLGPSRPLLY